MENELIIDEATFMRRAGAPRGNKNAAKPTPERRVALSTSITRETKRELLRRAREAGTSTGRVIDALMR